MRIKAMFDLTQQVDPRYEALRQHLIDQVNQGAKPMWLRVVAGLIVEINFFYTKDNWNAYQGLAVKTVTIEDDGSDHFPVAGIYKLDDAQATVTHQVSHNYPLDETTLRLLVKESLSESSGFGTTRFSLPVVVTRRWIMTLFGNSFTSTNTLYEQARAGILDPGIRFSDTLADDQKVRGIELVVTSDIE